MSDNPYQPTTVKLSDGRELTPDLSHVTVKQFRAVSKGELDQKSEDELVAQVYGLSVEELLETSLENFNLLAKGFFEAASNPPPAKD